MFFQVQQVAAMSKAEAKQALVMRGLLFLFTALIAVSGNGCSPPKPDSAKSIVAKTTLSESKKTRNLKDLFRVGDSAETSRSSRSRIAFREVAAVAGIRFRRFSDVVPGRFFLPEIMGGGVAWFDFDRDGRMDLYAVNGCPLWDPDPQQTRTGNQLYRNIDGNQFEPCAFPSHSAVNRYGQGVAAGDFNSDGFPDLYLANFGSNVLLVNNGDGTFDDVTRQAQVDDRSWSTSVVWFDADGDGLEDLYVVNYLNVTRKGHKICKYDGADGYCGPGSWKGVEDRLFVNLGDGRFRESARQLGIDSRQGKGLAVIACDFDEDRRPEIYVANDMAANFLFTRSPADRNSKTDRRTYRNIAAAAACARSEDGRNEASMGIACADFDGDGRPDIFLTHFYQNKNTLYRNLGDLSFADDSKRTRVAAASYLTLGFGTVAADFDWDGDQDLFIANGHVLGPAHKPFEMKPQLLENDGRGIFSDFSATLGGYFDVECLGRGAAAGDFDNDGRVDFVVSHVDRPLALLKNETKSRFRFIGLQLLTRNRTSPIGARVGATIGGRKRTSAIVGGGSYLSTNDPRLVIGLKDHTGPVRFEVTWPSGETYSYGPLEPGRYWLIREGNEPLQAATGTFSESVGVPQK